MFDANNPFAYPVSSFNQRVKPPTLDPDEGEQVSVCFSAEYTPLIMGALDQLLLPTTWDSDDPAVIQLAQNRCELLKSLLQAPACATEEIGTPFWDDDEDVDDSEPADVQEWYGTVTDPDAPPAELDFVENALVWTFTGLLALATPEVGFAPAILFRTIAPKFIIAVRRGDVGEIIRIVVDGKDAVQVDTTPYSEGQVINVPVMTDPASSPPHSLLLIGKTA